MNPKYCVSLDTAKKLKELGFPQETDFYRVTDMNGNEFGPELFDHFPIPGGKVSEDWKWFAAPHVGELGEWLPQPNPTAWYVKQDGTCQTLFFCYGYNGENEECFEAETEAEARAQMLIYLAENKLLDPKQIKSLDHPYLSE